MLFHELDISTQPATSPNEQEFREAARNSVCRAGGAEEEEAADGRAGF